MTAENPTQNQKLEYIDLGFSELLGQSYESKKKADDLARFFDTTPEEIPDGELIAYETNVVFVERIEQSTYFDQYVAVRLIELAREKGVDVECIVRSMDSQLGHDNVFSTIEKPVTETKSWLRRKVEGIASSLRRQPSPEAVTPKPFYRFVLARQEVSNVRDITQNGLTVPMNKPTRVKHWVYAEKPAIESHD